MRDERPEGVDVQAPGSQVLLAGTRTHAHLAPQRPLYRSTTRRSPAPAISSPRHILHVDMDAFYASVEQRDDPSLRGLPLAVGSDTARGVVAAASYEARAFGVHSALTSRIAVKRCPHLRFVRPRFDVYKAVSVQVRAVFERHTDVIEPLSLDEAYLDVTACAKTQHDAVAIAREIKAGVLRETALTCTAGVAGGKFVAKLASGMNKPDGLTVVRPEEVVPMLRALDVAEFHGVGPATARKMGELAIATGADLADYDRVALLRRFGKRGAYFQDIARGIDERPVRPNRLRKSVSAETTFSRDYETAAELAPLMPPLAEKVWARLRRLGRRARGVVVKVKYRNHEIQTRQQALGTPVRGVEHLLAVAEAILREKIQLPLPVRLLGVGVYDLTDASGAVLPDGSPAYLPGETGRLDF